MQRWLVGGDDYGHLTLTRFYGLHVALLPALTALILAAHVALFRRHGVTPPESADPKKVDSFYPKQVGMDLAFGLVVLALLFGLTLREHGAPLDAPADPSSDYPARPEWYFLALFELLKFVPGHVEWIAAVGLPLLLGGYLVALPFLDRSPTRALAARARFLVPLGIVAAGAAVLTNRSLRNDAHDPAFQSARKTAEARARHASDLASKGVPPAGPLAMLAADPVTRGRVLFEKHCASCHRLGDLGPDAAKATAPDLSGWGSRAWVAALLDDPDAPHLFGNGPLKGMMPSFKRPPPDEAEATSWKPLPEADERAMLDFFEAQAKGEEAKDSEGEKQVKRRCTTCHRLDGDDPLDAESLAPELRGWASLAWTRAQIANPGGGKTYPEGVMAAKLTGHMPAFERELEPKDLDLLASWLVATAPKLPVAPLKR
jgi:ubiquinol-cytochrome c reductase cytochrome b subunit